MEQRNLRPFYVRKTRQEFLANYWSHDLYQSDPPIKLKYDHPLPLITAKMTDLSQDPLAKCLVKFCKKPYNPLQYLEFQDILSINVLAQDYRKYSIIAIQRNKPIENSVTRGLADRLKWLVEKNDKEHTLIILFCFLSDIVSYLNQDDDLGIACEVYKKEFTKPLFSLDILKLFIINRDYTDLLLQTLRLDLDIRTDGELHAAVIEDFLDDLVLTFYDLRKKYYKDAAQRIQCFKEDLIAAVMHPSRIQKLLDDGMTIDEVMNMY